MDSGTKTKDEHCMQITTLHDFRLALRQRILDVTGWEDLLLYHFSAMRNTDKPPILMITGNSSCGTSLLAQNLKHHVEAENGYFLTARFDHLMLPIPYEALVAAFTDFTSMVVNRGAEEIATMRQAIRGAVGEECFVLQQMIPALNQILGPSHCDRPVSLSQGMARRFVHDFRMFINAVCSVRKPFVLVLENVQWADQCSLGLLLGSAVNDENPNDLIMIGTYDASGLTSGSSLSMLLRGIEQTSDSSIVEVTCEKLSMQMLTNMVTKFLTSNDGRSADMIASVMYAKSNGSFLELDKLAHWLQVEGFVHYEHTSGLWTCDLGVFEQHLKGCNARDLLLLEISRLSRHQIHILKQLACLGLVIENEVHRCLLEQQEDYVWLLHRRGYLIESDHGLTFRDFETRRLIYESIAHDERRLVHLEIGKRLLRHMGEVQVDRHLFYILSQLHKSRPMKVKGREKAGIADLCLLAGQKAAKLSTFRIACIYLKFGIELLGPDCWDENYSVALPLYNALAEMLLYTRKYDEMNEVIELILSRATSKKDKFQAYSTRVYYLGVISRQQDALETGLSAMRLLGEAFPRRFVKIRLVKEFVIVSRALSRKSDEQLLRMPPTYDENKLACMRVLQIMLTYVLLSGNNSELAALIELRLMKLTLKHGMSVFAPFAFVSYGLIHVHVYRDWIGGYRYGELALKLQEKHGSIEYLPRVYMLFYSSLSSLRNSIRENVEPLRYATKIAVQTGDFESVGLCSLCFSMALFQASEPLHVVLHHFEENRQYLVANGQQTMLALVLPIMEAIYRYIGRSPDPLATKGVLIDFDVAMQEAILTGHGLARCVLIGIQSVIAFIFNEYETAYQNLLTDEDMRYFASAVDSAFNILLRALIVIAMARVGKEKVGLHRFLKRTSKQLNHFAEICPENCLDNALIFEAEYASLRGEDVLASSKYILATTVARNSKLSLNCAVNNELAACHFLRIGQHDTARPYFDDACEAYAKWGATAKLSRLLTKVNSIYGTDVTNHGKGSLTTK